MKNIRLLIGIIGTFILVAFISYRLGDRIATSTQSAQNESMSTTTSEGTLPPASTTTQGTKPAATVKPSSPTQTVPLKGTYTNSEHGFRIKHSDVNKVSNAFSTFHELGTDWRLFANPYNQGKSVVQITTLSVDQGNYYTGKQTYPLYYTAMVRIGVGTNTAECYASDNSEQKITNTTIQGVPFKKFSTTQVGNKNYVTFESYRTIRNNKCYVIEQIKNGSTFKEAAMKEGYTDAMLETHYAKAGGIVQSFTFTK